MIIPVKVFSPERYHFLILCLAVFCLSISLCIAQDSASVFKRASFNEHFQKGRYAVGANFFYAPTSSPSWTITGQAGYFIANKWLSGAQVTFYGENSVSKAGSGSLYSRSRQFAFSPEIFTRYYISRSRFRPFVQIAAGYKSYSAITVNRGADQEEIAAKRGMTYGAAIGLSYQVTRRINIELLYNRQYFQKKMDLGDLRLRLGATVLF